MRKVSTYLPSVIDSVKGVAFVLLLWRTDPDLFRVVRIFSQQRRTKKTAAFLRNLSAQRLLNSAASPISIFELVKENF